MNKKYMVMFLCALFTLSASSAFARHDKDAKRAMKRDNVRMYYIADDCSVVFPKALGGNLDAFEDRAENYMSSSSFWETCVQPYLDKGQNVAISYTAFTENEAPNARDVAQAVRSAKDFTEEFTDYVEDVQEYTGAYEKPETFTYLQVPSSVNTNKQLMKEVKKVNKHFKAKSAMPKVNVNVKFAKAEEAQGVGAVRVAGPSAKVKPLSQVLQPAQPMKTMQPIEQKPEMHKAMHKTK